MKIGRRKAQFINICVGLLGISITMMFNYPCLLVGRVLYGFASGSITSSAARYNEETLPAHLYDNLQILFVFSQTFGGLSAFMLGEFLPDTKDHAALKASEIWRLNYFFFPCALFTVALLSLTFIVKYDSIKFLVKQNKIPEAKKHLMLVYKNCNEYNVD